MNYNKLRKDNNGRTSHEVRPLTFLIGTNASPGIPSILHLQTCIVKMELLYLNNE